MFNFSWIVYQTIIFRMDVQPNLYHIYLSHILDLNIPKFDQLIKLYAMYIVFQYTYTSYIYTKQLLFWMFL